jgi:hypothetical protein
MVEQALSAQLAVSVVTISPVSSIWKNLSTTMLEYYLLEDRHLKYALIVSIMGLIPFYVMF